MPVAIPSESGRTYQAQSERNVERGDLPFEHPHGMSDARIDGPFEITADRGEMLSSKLWLRTFHRIDKVWKYTDRCGLRFDDTAIRIIGQATAPGALGKLGLHRLNVCPEAAAGPASSHSRKPPCNGRESGLHLGQPLGHDRSAKAADRGEGRALR